jgi:glycerol-3-phosphate dehydrogenase subunit C
MNVQATPAVSDCATGSGVRRLDPRAIRQSMDACTKCGICQAHCPVAAVTEMFPGPKYAGPQAQRFRVIGVHDEHSAALCSGCGICTSVCPNDVAITDIIALAKADMATQHGVGFGQRLLNRPDTVGKIGGWLPWLGNALLSNRVARILAERLFGIDRAAPLPRFAGKRFEHWLKGVAQPQGPSIGYFPGCSVTHYDPDTGIAAIRLLNALGYRVEVPSSACCSLPMLSSGELSPASVRATSLIESLAPTAHAGTPILSTSTSCSLTLRSKYAANLGRLDGDAVAVSDSVADICGFLLDRHADELAQRFKPVRKRIFYHGPCQLRGHRLGLPAAELMALIPGLDITLSRADCCGVAGTYGYDTAKRPVAESVGSALVAQVRETKPDIVVCDSETCRWNIADATGIDCVHPVAILTEALGL